MLRRTLALILFTGLLVPGTAWAEQATAVEEPAPKHELATFAEKEHAYEAASSENLSVCGVCGTRRVQTTQMVEILGGRYEFENVEQAYCPTCHVTTINMEKTPRTARFFRLLWWRLPASRSNVVRTKDRFAMALTTSAEQPFISGISGLQRQDGQVFFEVE